MRGDPCRKPIVSFPQRQARQAVQQNVVDNSPTICSNESLIDVIALHQRPAFGRIKQECGRRCEPDRPGDRRSWTRRGKFQDPVTNLSVF